MNAVTKKLVEDFQHHEIRALTKLISLAENEDLEAFSAMELLSKTERRARVLGITGPPGAGKSSLISAFIEPLRSAQKRVAVLAVDPTSPISGGAVLGDRIRLTDHFNDPGVFIRSVSTRGRLGGISLATPQSISLVESFGFDYLFVESVGVGQNEHEISRWTDVTVLVLTPDSGDGIQAIKAGVLELADIIVVNKNEEGRGEGLLRELESTFRESGKKMPVICATSEKDPASRKALSVTLDKWFSDNQKLRADRRASVPKKLCQALVAGYVLDLAAKWAEKQDLTATSPYAAFRAFQKALSKEKMGLS